MVRRNNPDFRWKYESYEMMCCTQAVLMADKFPNQELLKEFKDLNYKKQKRMLPGLDEGHSGNSFGCACFLAKLYVNKRYDDIIKMHGALAALVGSKEYGCVPKEIKYEIGERKL